MYATNMVRGGLLRDEVLDDKTVCVDLIRGQGTQQVMDVVMTAGWKT
jgi:hypothetical protein